MTTDNEAGIFDAWPTIFEPPTRRIVDPPKSANVNFALAIGRSGGGGFRDTTPLKVRAEGLEPVKCCCNCGEHEPNHSDRRSFSYSM
jgi:hypothetical protein